MKLQHLIRPRRRRLLHVAVSVVLLTVAAPMVQHTAADGGQTAAQVADEIVGVQATADQVAGEWSQREADAQRLTTRTAAARAAVGAAAAVVHDTEAKVSALAIDRYTSVVEPVLLPFAERGTTRLERQTLSGFASNTSLDDLDRFQAARATLENEQQILDDTAHENDAALAGLVKTRQQLDAELARLQQLQTKLKDAEVRQAYETKLAALRAEQVAKAEADARAAAQQQTKAIPTARGDAPATSGQRASLPGETPATAPAPTSRRATNPVEPSSPTPTQPPAPAPAPAAEPARPVLPSGPVINGLICPVNGPNSFGDSWGAPRSGGKTHEGVDMMSPQGTRLVAAIDGFANMHTNRLGGNTVGLRASDGNYYYYAHLSAWEGPSRNVRQGEVIGYVGHTGETSADHLHFGIYVGGGTGPATNPYPIVRKIC